MNLTDINPVDIITHIKQNFNRDQAVGLNSLIFLALREDTSVACQWRSWGSEDIPDQVIGWCGRMDEHDLLELAASIANGLLDEDFTAALDTENAKRPTVQAIDDQNQPTLLSDY